MNRELFFASAGDERGTPTDFFAALDAEFHFTLDAAASPENKKCELYFGFGGIADDALNEDWGGEDSVVFLNCPYSIAGAFVRKAREEADKGAVVVLLLPVRTDTKWWQSTIWDKDAWSDAQLDEVAENRNRARMQPDGNWRPGVRVRLLPGRLSFELKVPAAMRALVKEAMTGPYLVSRECSRDSLIETTGLPKMAIEGIVDDKPDEDLLSSAPFPSAVVIFRSTQA